MAIVYNNAIPPKNDFIGFESEEHLIEKLSEWGFSKSTRENVLFKDGGYTYKVKIVGYEEYEGAFSNELFNTIIIEFDDGKLHCVHPAHLKEMQSSRYENKPTPASGKENSSNTSNNDSQKQQTSNKPKPTKKAGQKLDLPNDKVHFLATVKEFTTKYNPFTESDDEILVLEDVVIQGENELKIGNAWCGYSQTLKKLDLSEGEKIEFDAKIAAKKLNSEVLYKINRPSKIVKL